MLVLGNKDNAEIQQQCRELCLEAVLLIFDDVEGLTVGTFRAVEIVQALEGMAEVDEIAPDVDVLIVEFVFVQSECALDLFDRGFSVSVSDEVRAEGVEVSCEGGVIAFMGVFTGANRFDVAILGLLVFAQFFPRIAEVVCAFCHNGVIPSVDIDESFHGFLEGALGSFDVSLIFENAAQVSQRHREHGI